VTVPRDEPVDGAHDPANGRDPPQRAYEPTAGKHSRDGQGGITPGVDPPGPLIEDVELIEDRAVSGRGGDKRSIGGQGVLERQELEPAVAIPLTEPSSRRLAESAITIEHDHEALGDAPGRGGHVGRGSCGPACGHQPLLAASG
jgi:hypothetical protein